MKPYLEDAEIAAITHPLTQGAARIKFLRRLGCLVKPKPDGQPLVGRAEYEAVMTAKQHRTRIPMPSNVVMPNWEALRAAGGRKSKTA